MHGASRHDQSLRRALFSSKVGLIFVVTLFCVSLSLVSAQTEDVTPPTLTAFDFTPTTIDTRSGQAVVTVSVSATDDLSGIQTVQARFASPSGQWRYASSSFYSSPPTSLSTTMNATFPQFSETGTWRVDFVSLTDALGNVRTYYPTELNQLGFPTELVVEDVTPPTASAGENLTITSGEQCGTVIQGTASDPDNDPLQYRWLEEEREIVTWTSVGPNGEAHLDLCPVSLSLGQHTLTLEVSDGQATARDDMILTIGNSAPHIAPTGDGVYQLGMPITVGGQVSDFDGDLLTYTWSEGMTYCTDQVQSVAGGIPVHLPGCDLPDLGLGIHLVTLTVSDGMNAPVSRDIIIEVVDTTAPTLAPGSNVSILWPPNHTMVDIIIQANASDTSGDLPTLSASVTSNEPQEGLGDGDLSPDWTAPVINQTTGVITLQLRAERSGSGHGRLYTVSITATDEAGNASTATVEIIVSHDPSPKK